MISTVGRTTLTMDWSTRKRKPDLSLVINRTTPETSWCSTRKRRKNFMISTVGSITLTRPQRVVLRPKRKKV